MKKQEKHHNYKVKILEAFGGIGAFSKASKKVFGKDNVKIIDYIDVLNWSTFAFNKIHPQLFKPQDIRRWNLDVDILLHGSPCQDFSNAGTRQGGERGSSTRSSLLWETLNIIKEKLNKPPTIVIWENVKAVLNKSNKPIFEQYLNEMESIGYSNNWDILNGIDFGIPQKRKRVFVVSILKEHLQEFKHFSFTNLKKIKPKPIIEFLEKDVAPCYFITQPSMIDAIKNKKIEVIDQYANTITTKQMRWNNGGVVKVPLTEITLTTKVHVAMLPKTKIFNIDGEDCYLRLLTERECWRLMGFDDQDYNNIRELPKTAKYLLAGNSIIPQKIEAILKLLYFGKEE